MNNSVPKGSGNLGVDLSHANGGLFEGFMGHVNSNPQAAKTVRVGRCNLNNGDVNRPEAGCDQLGNLYEPAGY